jgi:hypothetical protein
LRGVVTITGIEWDGWDGPEEQTIVLTKGAELTDAELVTILQEGLEERHGHTILTMTMHREGAKVAAPAPTPTPKSPTPLEVLLEDRRAQQRREEFRRRSQRMKQVPSKQKGPYRMG